MGREEQSLVMHLLGRRIEVQVGRAQSIGTAASLLFAHQKTKNFLKLAGVYEPTLVADVGANVGIYSIVYSLAWPKAKILAIEPILENLELLRQNTAPFPNIEIIPVAVGDKAGRVTMQMPTPDELPSHAGIAERNDHDIMSIHGTSGRFKQEVECQTLDAIIGDAPVGFMKIDAEAHEYYVLKGADSILRSQRPGLFIEIVPVNQAMAGHIVEDILLLLATYKYAYMTSAHINQLFRPA